MNDPIANNLADLIMNRDEIPTFQVSPYGQVTEIALVDTIGADWYPREGYVTVQKGGEALHYLGFTYFEDAQKMYEMLALSHGVPVSRIGLAV